MFIILVGIQERIFLAFGHLIQFTVSVMWITTMNFASYKASYFEPLGIFAIFIFGNR